MNQPDQKSLLLIEEMINKAKNHYSENGFLYLFWGWLVFGVSLAHYLLLLIDYPYPFLPWMLMPMGTIFTIIYIARTGSVKAVKTYADEIIGYVWIAFFVALMIVLIFMQRLQLSTYPLVMLLYGVPTFISGGILKHRPLIYGAVSCWALAIISFYQPFNVQLLLLALAVLLAYIIPGYLLKRKFNAHNANPMTTPNNV